ncbi:hypothetical protein TNCV_689572 [Trichonephila clavipes]|nr:hypothetical protein TNCV_689572 [Trichonephila clavipes]
MILRKCDTPVQFLGLLNNDQSAPQPSLMRSCPHCERWTDVQNGDHCSLIDDPSLNRRSHSKTRARLISKCCFHHLIGFGARFTELKAKLDTDSCFHTFSFFDEHTQTLHVKEVSVTERRAVQTCRFL